MPETKLLVEMLMITTSNQAKLMKVGETTVIFIEIQQLMKVLEEPANLISKESLMEFQAVVAKCQSILSLDTRDMIKSTEQEKMSRRFKTMTRKKTMTHTKHSILAKMKITYNKTSFHHNSEPIIQNKILLVVLLEKGTSRTIVKKVWVWVWEIDKAVDTTLKMKVEV